MELASPPIDDDGRQAQSGDEEEGTSRLRRLSDPVLLVVLLLPQVVWVGVVVYLLHRGA
jgi:hypothetical protein